MTEAELNEWLGDEGTLEALFLGKIAESAFPTVVHSPVTASTSSSRYGVAPAYLPFSIYRPWRREELTQERPVSVRARLGLEPGQVAIATFGFVQASKAPEECVWALEVLRRWGIAASFHFVGGIEPNPQIARIHALIRELGLEGHIRFANGYVSEQTYRDYLIGADLAVQLRAYTLGGLSGAVLDCAAALMSTV